MLCFNHTPAAACIQAVKIGKAMGMEVTVFSTSEKKRDEATAHLGADHFVVSKDADQMKVPPTHCLL